MSGSACDPAETANQIDVSIVMPCLNEAHSLAQCIANAYQALDKMRLSLGFEGEIVIADNGSTDGSQAIAERLGAHCVPVARRGYGAALQGGVAAAAGRYIVMGDADGSYDFDDAIAMVAQLAGGADLCMGSRFKGYIEPGAMPWKNRYIGNPVLTGILNVLFHSAISDAHCGIRAFKRAAFFDLGLSGEGMEFASEMVIKATLKGLKVTEVPATLRKDLRDRPPHLRPWRDGWRHLRYLLMLSPSWLFGIPAGILALFALAILATATLASSGLGGGNTRVGNYWIILAGGLLIISHTAALLVAAGHFFGLREGYRRQSELWRRLAPWLSLEAMLMTGLASLFCGLGVLAVVLGHWSANRFVPIGNVLPGVVGTALLAVGAQNVLGGFLLAIVNGNNADLKQQASEARNTHRTSTSRVPSAVSINA